MKERLKTLDGLRGICALIVAVSHGLKFLDISQIKNIEDITIFHIYGIQIIIAKVLLALFNATGAVYIFFILSGYVLALSLSKYPFTTKQTIAFYVRRFFRLIPVYFFSIFIILILLVILPPHNFTGISSYFATFYTFTINAPVFLSNLFFFQTNFNPISWTLQVEIIGSLLLPVFYFLSSRISLTKQLLFFLFLFLLGIFFRGTHPIHYLYIFYLGILLIRARDFFLSLQKNRYVSLCVIIFSLLSFTLPRGILLPSNSAISQLLEVVGGWLLIGLIVYSRSKTLESLLTTKIIQFYGKISYSFYLLNFILLFSLAVFLSRIIPHSLEITYSLLINLVITTISILFTTIAASLSYKFVELPSIMFSLRVIHSQKIRSILNREW